MDAVACYMLSPFCGWLSVLQSSGVGLICLGGCRHGLPFLVPLGHLGDLVWAVWVALGVFDGVSCALVSISGLSDVFWELLTGVRGFFSFLALLLIV